jgi:putative transposase
MLKAYKYRIYPNQEQQVKLACTFGCVRYIYNWGLALKTKSYALGTKLSCFETINQMKLLKEQEEYQWLNEVHSQPLQMALRNLDNAYTKFFKKTCAFPKFKSKKNKQSFQYPQGVQIDFENNKIFLPKIGKVDCIFHRKFVGKVKTCTTSKNPCGSYYVSVLVDTQDIIPNKIKLTSEKQAVGIDLGVKSFAVMSNNIEIANPKHLKSKEIRLAVKSRQLSKKVKGSKNRDKARIEVAKIHEKIANCRKDFHHQLSKAIIDKYDLICLEDLNVAGMVKNRKLSKAISDCGWSQFNSYLDYKAEWYGKSITRLPRFQATSQPCLKCGVSNKKVKNLAIREWICPECGQLNLRDDTASKNILKFGLIQVGFKELEPTINKSLWSGQPMVKSVLDFAKLEL